MKADELIKEKWYRNNFFESCDDFVIFKFRELINNKIYVGLKNTDTNKEFFINVINGFPSVMDLYTYNSIYIGDIIDIKEINNDDVMDYLNNNHPVKIIYLRKKKIKSLLN